ncbi:DUF262 domain-containing protein [Chromohalobacter japonicus]|uniref:DUF262 domain-containing protein n=1 Tax=Chromohalobacter japonicus TaxID=223900 RepID=UPI00058C6408|nr:DUF262 domain-containing protein [Chromohalobacter japonicus]
MENGQKTLKELFDGRKIFNIPDYQRAYAWDEFQQLPDFLEDIESQSLGRDYFFGTILFQEKSDKKSGFDVIDVVDGQQRITTIIIFMKVLLSELQERISEEEFEEIGLDLAYETYVKNKKRAKLQAISPDDDFFQNYILGDEDGFAFIETPSQRRLYRAKRYFMRRVGVSDNEELISFKSKIDEFTKVLTYSVKDSAEATLIFETTNDRGKGLTKLEKIKSFLMYKTYLAAGDDIEVYLKSVQERFTEVFRDLEMFDGKLDEDTVLQYHCIAFESWREKEDYQQPVSYVRKILNPLIKKGRKGEALEFIDRFSRELKESFRIMRDLLRSQSPQYRDLVCLERMGNFNPLLLKTFKHDDSLNKARFASVCKLLEIFSFRVFALQQNRSNTGQSRLFAMAREFSGKFEPLCDRLIEVIDNFSPKKKFKEHLRYTDFYQFMSPRDLSYLMWKYENHLRENEQPICSKMSEGEYRDSGNKTRLTVEHIASQNPKDYGIVKDESVMLGIDSEFLEEHMHRLGNLTFDPASANSSKGNNRMEVKNSKYFSKAPYKTQNELELFLVDGKWGVESIGAREDKIVKFCLRNWSPEYVC